MENHKQVDRLEQNVREFPNPKEKQSPSSQKIRTRIYQYPCEM